MFRSAFGRGTLLAPVFCLIEDKKRAGNEHFARRGHNVQIELGEGVEELSYSDFRMKVDEQLKRDSKRFTTILTGKVFDSEGQELKNGQVVKAYEKYTLTGSMMGGYVKNDMKYGRRLTGFNHNTSKMGFESASRKQ